MSDNKPCPFCGATDVHTSFENGGDCEKWGYAACTHCGAQTGTIRTQYETGDNAAWRIEAVKEWNTRFNTNE